MKISELIFVINDRIIFSVLEIKTLRIEVKRIARSFKLPKQGFLSIKMFKIIFLTLFETLLEFISNEGAVS